MRGPCLVPFSLIDSNSTQIEFSRVRYSFRHACRNSNWEKGSNPMKIGSTRLGTPNLERAALGTAKTELGTAFQLQPLGTAKKAELGLKAEQVLYII